MLQKSFINSLGILVYVGILATFLQNGERIFGQGEDTIFAPIIMMLLLSTSALVVGSLAVGKPVMLYLDNKKKEAVSMLVATAGWMAAFTIIAIIIAAVVASK